MESRTISKRSLFTGTLNTMTIVAPAEEWAAFESGRELIQVAMPSVGVDAREFLMTGCTPAEWNAMFKEPEDA